MKTRFLLFASLLLLISMTGCSGDQAEQPVKNSDTVTEAESQSISEEPSTVQPESSEAEQATEEDNDVLIVYFSRWGNTEFPEDVDATASASIVVDGEDYGTTEYVARLIQEQIGGDLHLIQTQEKYPADFDELRDLNHEEMAEGYLPPLVESGLDVSQYDTVFIGYPVWATDVPQAVLSFLQEYDLSGKTVIPFCTHGGYGAGDSYSTIRENSHAAQSPEGLAINAEDIHEAESVITDWLNSIGL